MVRLVVMLLLVSCADSSPSPDVDAAVPPTDSGSPDSGDAAADDDAAPDAAALATFEFVSDSVRVPTGPAEVSSLGLDIDGDPEHSVDNLLGRMLATFAWQDIETQPVVDQAVSSGGLLLLHEVRAADLTTSQPATWHLLRAQVPAAPPLFDGTDSLAVDGARPAGEPVSGAIVDGTFTGGPGTVVLFLPILSRFPVALPLQGARLEAEVSAASCTGRLGGAIREADFEGEVIPAIAAGIRAQIASSRGCQDAMLDCPLAELFDRGISCLADGVECPVAAPLCDIPAGQDEGSCSCGAATCDGHLAGDRVVTVEELRADDLLASLTEPDVDLFDAAGAFNPRVDGIDDSLSIGVGFSCVPASF